MLLLLLLCCQTSHSISSVIRLGHYYYYDVSTSLFDRKFQVESQIYPVKIAIVTITQ